MKVKELVRKIDTDTKNMINQMAKVKTPTLDVVMVDEGGSNLPYFKSLKRKSSELGVKFNGLIIEGSDDWDDGYISETNRRLMQFLDKSIRYQNGIILLDPLPEPLNREQFVNSIPTHLDVDCMNSITQAESHHHMFDGFFPNTALAILELLKFNGIDLVGKDIVVINRTYTVGMPLSNRLTHEGSTVTVCHSKTKGLKRHTQRADIVITATGQDNMLDVSYFKEDAIVIDFGVTNVGGKWYGDVDPKGMKGSVRDFVTITDGLGQVTTALLFNQLVRSHYNYK